MRLDYCMPVNMMLTMMLYAIWPWLHLDELHCILIDVALFACLTKLAEKML